MKKIITVLLVGMVMSSCAHSNYNKTIADYERNRMSAYGDAMAKQTSETGRMAVAMAFAYGMGSGKFQRDDTVLDYASAFIPYANLLLPLAYGGGWHRYGNGDIEAGGDIYMNSARADSRFLNNSVLQEYGISGQGNWVGSNEPMNISAHEGSTVGAGDGSTADGMPSEVEGEELLPEPR